MFSTLALLLLPLLAVALADDDQQEPMGPPAPGSTLAGNPADSTPTAKFKEPPLTFSPADIAVIERFLLTKYREAHEHYERGRYQAAMRTADAILSGPG